MLTNEIDIEALIAAMYSKAADMKHSAGMNGEWHDGGASDLVEQIEAFKCGMTGQIPNGWLEVANQMKNEDDPDWETYQRLKKKFKEKR